MTSRLIQNPAPKRKNTIGSRYLFSPRNNFDSPPPQTMVRKAARRSRHWQPAYSATRRTHQRPPLEYKISIQRAGSTSTHWGHHRAGDQQRRKANWPASSTRERCSYNPNAQSESKSPDRRSQPMAQEPELQGHNKQQQRDKVAELSKSNMRHPLLA